MPRLIAATAAKPPPRGPKFTLRDTGRVHQPGEKGYHGPIQNERDRDTWARGVHNQNRREGYRAVDTATDRRNGRLAYGIGGGFLAVGTVGGLAADAKGKQRAKGAVRKARFTPRWSPADPMIRHATPVRGAQDISSLPPRKTREQRVAEWVGGNPQRMQAVMYGGYGAGVGALAGGSASGAARAKNAKQRKRAKVAKSRGGAEFRRHLKLKEHFGSPTRAAATVGRNPQHIAAGGVLAGGLSLQRPEARRQRPNNRGANTATAASVGGVGGHLGWMAYGQQLRAKGHALERTRPEGMSRNQHEKIMRAHRQKHGVPHGQNPNRQQAPGYFKDYPKELPAAPYKRKLGRIGTGRAGIRNQALSIAGGAGLAALGTSQASRGSKQAVHKALYQREERLSPVRTTTFLTGAGLAAWGGGRSKMIGSALGRGVKAASGRDNHRAVQALTLAQSFQGVLARGTAPGERALRQVQLVDHAVRAVPAAIRPEVALSAGLLLAGRSMPIRREHYKPVSRPIPVRPMGW